MERTKFTRLLEEKIQSEAEHLTQEEIDQCHKMYLDYHKANKPDEIYVIPMEEMAELAQHLSKIIRGKEQLNDIGVLEEIADVQICLDNLKIHIGIEDDILKYAMDIKFENARDKIKKGTA